MKKTVKLLVMTALFICLLTLASCSDILSKLPFDIPGISNPGDNPDDDPAGGDDNADLNSPKITLIENNTAKFKFVYTKEAGKNSINYINDIIEQLREIGVTIDDAVDETDAELITACEIIVGTAAENRGEELTVTKEELGKEGVLIKISGNKILIAGGTADLTLSALKSYIKNEMGITNKTNALETLAVSRDYSYSKETTYRIQSITIAGIDLKDFTLIYDFDELDAKYTADIKSFHDDIYDISGCYMKLGDAADASSYEHGFIIRYTDDAGDKGFRAFYDGKNFIVECAYANVFSELFEDFANSKFLNTTGTNIVLSENYVYDDVDATYLAYSRSAEERAAVSLEKSLELIRNGSGASAYGAYAVAVLGMADNGDTVTANDLKIANQAVQYISNYLTIAGSSDTYGGRGEIDFVAIRLVRLLFIDKDKLEMETRTALERFFLNDDFTSLHASENHYLMSHVSKYLAASYYKGLTFNQFGATAEEILEEEYNYLLSYMQYRARRGWGEFNSLGYEAHNFNSLMALYECAPHSDIRKLAEMLMETMLLSHITNTTEDGIAGGAHGRAGAAATSGVDIGIYWLNWFYFGLGDFDDVSSYDMPASSEPYILLSSWRPDISLYKVYEEKIQNYNYSSYERVHNHAPQETPKEYGSISKYTYNTEYYSIGCINRQDTYPLQEWYEEHQQTNMSLLFADDPASGITVHHPNDNGSHCYWYGDQMCHCNHLFGYENVVMGIFYITTEQSEEFNFVHAKIPTDLCDEVIEDKENNRIFIRIGDAYAALTFSHSYEWGGRDSDTEIVIYDGEKTSDIRIAFALEAGDVKTNGSFEQFIASIKAKEFKFKADALQLIYGNMRYEIDVDPSDETEVTAENQYIDGVLQSEHYDCTYNSPFMKSVWDSGVIEIYYDGKVRTLDFINITDITREIE